MVGLVPVEALARYQQDLLLVQKVECELLVVGDVELLGVDLREDVETALGFTAGDAVDLLLSALYTYSRCSYTRPPGTT